MAEHSERQHPKYSGSGIKRLRRCLGWARFAKALGRSWENSEDAKEGTARHELLEIILLQGEEAARQDERWSEKRYAALTGLISYITKLRSEYPDLQVWAEQAVFFPQNVVRQEEAGGTADVVCYSAAARRGWLLDFKNGVTEVEDPEENDQLWFYATAFFWGIPVEEITLVIAQPNGLGVPEIRDHTINALELIQFRAEIVALILRAEAPDVMLTPGAWCSGCSVGSECGAREREAIGALTGSPGTEQALLVAELPKPEALDVERWASIRRKSAFVRSWLADIDRAAFAFAMNGGKVPGEKLVEAAARRVFIGTPQETAAGLAEITGKSRGEFLSVVCVGVTAAEAEVKQAAKKSPNPTQIRERFAALTDKQSTGNLSLVPVDDRRPEYNPAAKNFTGVVPVDLIGAT